MCTKLAPKDSVYVQTWNLLRRDQRWFKSLRRPPALNWGDSENYCELSLTQATVGSLDQGDLE